jgi:hypothetical protein
MAVASGPGFAFVEDISRILGNDMGFMATRNYCASTMSKSRI